MKTLIFLLIPISIFCQSKGFIIQKGDTIDVVFNNSNMRINGQHTQLYRKVVYKLNGEKHKVMPKEEKIEGFCMRAKNVDNEIDSLCFKYFKFQVDYNRNAQNFAKRVVDGKGKGVNLYFYYDIPNAFAQVASGYVVEDANGNYIPFLSIESQEILIDLSENCQEFQNMIKNKKISYFGKKKVNNFFLELNKTCYGINE